MPFFMTPERQQVVDTARRFAQKELRPRAREIDRSDEFPVDLFKKMGALGFLGITLPEQYNGSGGDLTTLALVIEELSKECVGIAQNVIAHTCLVSQCLNTPATPEQKEKWLSKLTTGEKIGVYCFTEPCGNSNLAGWKTRAVRDGDDWVINGGKMFCTNVGVADYYYVCALTEGAMDPATMVGATTFLVERGTPGLRVGRIEDKVGWRGSSTGQVFFDEVRVPESHRISPLGMGLLCCLESPPFEMICEAASALGLAQHAYEKTLSYARERMDANGLSFYQKFETMRTRIVEMKMKIEALRAFVYSLTDMMDRGENVYPTVFTIKPYAFALAEEICSTAVNLHGGNGVVADTGIEQLWRDAKVGMIGGGQYDMMLDMASAML